MAHCKLVVWLHLQLCIDATKYSWIENLIANTYNQHQCPTIFYGNIWLLLLASLQVTKIRNQTENILPALWLKPSDIECEIPLICTFVLQGQNSVKVKRRGKCLYKNVFKCNYFNNFNSFDLITWICLRIVKLKDFKWPISVNDCCNCVRRSLLQVKEYSFISFNWRGGGRFYSFRSSFKQKQESSVGQLLSSAACRPARIQRIGKIQRIAWFKCTLTTYYILLHNGNLRDKIALHWYT